MKRIILALTMALTFATTYSFAGEVKVSGSILQDFKTRFLDAEDLSWSQANGFTIAQFTIDGEKQFAYYNTAGDLTVVAQPLTFRQLSKGLQANLSKNYKDYSVTDVYRLEDSNDAKYYVVVENSTKKIILKATSNRWDVVKTTNK